MAAIKNITFIYILKVEFKLSTLLSKIFTRASTYTHDI